MTHVALEGFVQGLVIGFGIAAPVGPIGLLCIRRSITGGRTAGFVSGLGAATADALYGTVAALGLTAVSRFLVDHRTVIQLLGGLFLLYLGFSLFRTKPPVPSTMSAPRSARNLAGAYASTFALTLANPATVLSFVGIFAGLGFGTENSGILPAALLVTGVFAGSAAWWLALSAAAHGFGGKIGPSRLRIVNTLSGALLAAFGLWQLAAILRP